MAKEARTAIVWLAPDTISPSRFRDRLEDPSEDSLDGLKASISRDGQAMAITVRREGKGFMCVCGHRRLAACSALKIEVMAEVRSMTDEEALKLQGLENAERLDLTFIERARFAHRLFHQCIERSLIAKTVAVDQPELSRLLNVAHAFPSHVLDAIGIARGVGRNRWLALKDVNRTPRQRGLFLRRIEQEIKTKAFAAATSNARFTMLSDIALGTTEMKRSKSAVLSKSGKMIAQVSIVGDALTVKFDPAVAPFARRLADKLSDLLEEYESKSPSG